MSDGKNRNCDLANDVHVWKKDGACRCGEHKRCLAVFTNRKTCRRRSNDKNGFCAAHGEVIARHTKACLDALAERK